ncbi:hypothetical protein EPN87_02725 [archaeon]|nr:MAG: hypothetical protein EPN87_02725 [archaeon]
MVNGDWSGLQRLGERLSEVGLNLSIYERKPPKYVRINPRKPLNKNQLETSLRSSLYETSVPNVFRCNNHHIGSNDYFHRGLFYISDLSSLIPVMSLGLKESDYMLDLCAAPGVKSSFAYDLVNGDLRLFCIEKDLTRFRRMLGYFHTYGIRTYTYNQDGTEFQSKVLFDKVIVDVPCSEEGNITKLDNILSKSQWYIENISQIQLKLIQRGYDLLKTNGTLVYSTCALNKHENEGVVSEFLERNPNAKVDLPSISNPDITFVKSENIIRIIPGKTKGACFTRIIKSTV